MWERFSYYGMRALLILFMTAAPASGGLGFDTAKAGAVYGLYTSMVYLLTLPGGWLADRWLGQRRSVLYGGILIASGHFSMAVPTMTTFYLGLVLIVIGTGLLKGNIAVLVGQLYAPSDNRRDAGFSIYYMGINLGAFLAPLVCGYLGQRVNWHLGFAAAGIGMVLGLVQYVLGDRYLGSAGAGPATAASPEAAAAGRRQAISWTVAAVIAASAFGVAVATGHAQRLGGADRGVGRLVAARRHGRLLRLALPRSIVDPAGARPALRRRRLLPVRRDLLVGVRAGRLHLESVRRSIDAQRRVRLGLPELVVSVAERVVHHRLRADVRLALDHASAAANPRARRSSRSASSASAPASWCWCRPRWHPATAPRSARCG